jgi:uncharacterized protein YaaW (UPF0174 family)
MSGLLTKSQIELKRLEAKAAASQAKWHQACAAESQATIDLQALLFSQGISKTKAELDRECDERLAVKAAQLALSEQTHLHN